MLLSAVLPLLAFTPLALAGFLDLFARDRCFPNPCYRAVRAVSTASADCYSPTLPSYASGCHDTSRFSSACSCLGISAAPTSTSTSALATISTPTSTSISTNAISPPAPIDDAVAVSTTITTTISTTLTTTLTITTATATISTPVCISTTWTGTVTTWTTTTAVAWSTAWVTTTLIPSPDPVASQVVDALQPSNCLTDVQASNIVAAFHDMRTNADRGSVNATAGDLIAEEFFMMSGSENSLAGQDVTTITDPSKAAYLADISSAPAIPMLTTLDVFHDCNRIAWYWAAQGELEVRGVDLIYTIPQTLEVAAMAAAADGVVSTQGSEDFGGRKVNMLMSEFNAVAWAGNEGRGLCA